MYLWTSDADDLASISTLVFTLYDKTMGMIDIALTLELYIPMNDVVTSSG